MNAIRVRPRYVAAHTALGKLYKESNQYARAMAEFRVAVELDGSNRAALNHLASLLRLSGNTEEAAALTSRLRKVVIGSVATDQE